ncbi:MAG: iron hydrogenase small subunit, partial [Lentisphaeria bacterium]|nr:iron hydrogenase small subunit [Lentisphaeria bacterium]
ANKPLRLSHQNPDIKKLYDEYLGTPGSEKSHHLLHTHYHQK